MANGREIWTIGRILKWTEDFFQKKGIESPRLDAEVLLAHLLKKERIYLYVHFDEPLESEELQAFHTMIAKRAKHVPVAYILGEKEFMGLTFKVTPDTLVPRPDTEILVQTAMEDLKKLGEVRGEDALTFADIGTGTGAICLSILHEMEQITAFTVEISDKARAVAEENAERLGVKDRVEFFTGNLLEPLKGRTFDAILSNPPYIPTKDMAGLQAEVRENEPKMALDGGADGLDCYRKLLADGPQMLNEDGFMAVEVGIHQAEPVAELAKENPLIGETEIHKDYAGIERVVVAWRKA